VINQCAYSIAVINQVAIMPMDEVGSLLIQRQCNTVIVQYSDSVLQ
jgi:hypothetical protein